MAFPSVARNRMAEINVTPMIDILLVLLILFMIIGPLRSTGFDTPVPEPATEAGSDAFSLVITVHADQTIDFNQETLPLAGLEARLREVYRTAGDRVVFVRAAEDLEFQPVIHVIDIARGAGLRRVALMPR